MNNKKLKLSTAYIKKTISYFYNFSKKYKIYFFISLLGFAIITVVGFVFFPIYMKKIIDIFEANASLSVLDRNNLYPEIMEIFFILFLIQVFAFGLSERIADFAIVYFETSVMKDLQDFCFKKLNKQSFDFFANNFVGSLMTKINRFVRAFEKISDIFIFNIWTNLLRFIFSIIIISLYASLIAFYISLWIILYFSIIYFFTIKWKIKTQRKQAEANSIMSGILADNVSNMITIKMFSRRKYEENRFAKFTKDAFMKLRKTWNTDNKIRIIQSILMATIELFILYKIINMWMAKEISIGVIFLIQIYLGQIYMNLWDFGRTIKDLYSALIDSEEMVKILEKKPTVLDIKNPEPCKISDGKIEFQNVDFSYYEDGDHFFKKLNLKIKAGQKIGIIGESGAGKTTFTKLLLRFSDVNGGTIKIDNQDISKITQDDLRKKISFVPQDPILFHRSLFENIKYGKLDATDEEIKKSAIDSRSHDFIMKTKDKYKTLVGERGVKLSGGERQRIAIARAMLKNTPILILDEATSSLDSKSEKIIQDSLKNLMKGKTVIAIAHRLSTLKEMDEIIVFDNGKITERGKHKNLIDKNGIYANLWKHQASAMI